MIPLSMTSVETICFCCKFEEKEEFTYAKFYKDQRFTFNFL